MTFDLHEDGETFYNAYAKVNDFSIRNYNMHKDNTGIVKVNSSDKASANTMHKVGIKTSHIMDFVAQQFGGYESVGYMQKDLYNHFTAQRNIEVTDGDAEGALAYLCAKAKNDPLFYYKYDVDEQNWLNNLFWRDVTCRTDYLIPKPCINDK
ncbi:hypothetical protein RHMOL_Rhmol08G0107500 [Rhododendron molle]|uniref:Uncharacterized protein n=1 Tax=Rhododendron molle TaxID=49168 RepID=A0ACC0MN33_RHOML|nr:hypothetical protein RHMOL_Rhmol08G0107500 [Rhododendron molle]